MFSNYIYFGDIMTHFVVLSALLNYLFILIVTGGQRLFYTCTSFQRRNKGDIPQDTRGSEGMDTEEVALQMMPGGVCSCPHA